MFDTSETEENAYEVEKVIRKNTWRRFMHGHVDWMYAWRGITGEGGYGPNYLTFTAEEAGSTLSLSWASASDVQTSTDRGTTWSAYARVRQLHWQM